MIKFFVIKILLQLQVKVGCLVSLCQIITTPNPLLIASKKPISFVQTP
jgi:hypothetical protein